MKINFFIMNRNVFIQEIRDRKEKKKNIFDIITKL